MNDLELVSRFEHDEHQHIYLTDDGQTVAKLKFSQLSDGRDNAVNCFTAVKFVFGEEDDPDPIMEFQRTNLTNKTSANGWNKVSGVLAQHGGWDWEPLIQKAISASLREWYEGTASHAPLELIDPDEVASPFLIEPLVSSSGMTMHYSPPGAGKSMVALAIAVSVATGYPIFGTTPETIGPVVYVDFEDVKRTHDQRVTAILKGMNWDGDMPDITHYKIAGKLTDHLSQIRAIIREMDAVLVIVDSLGKARGADPSDGDATIKLTNAIESLGMPVLAIDHVTKSHNEAISSGQMQNPEAVMGIGSQFSTAGARLGWFFQKMTDSKPLSVRFNLHNNKHNLVAKQDTRSMTMNIENNERGVITKLTFKTWDSIKFEELRVESLEVTIARWMVRTEKISTTTTEASKAIGASDTSVNRALQGALFEKMTRVGKSVPYRLTEAGTAAVGTSPTGEHDETQ